MWVDYLHIRDDYKLESDIMPDRLITEFNRALIAAGKEPEIYNILYDIRDGMFVRNDMRLEFLEFSHVMRMAIQLWNGSA